VYVIISFIYLQGNMSVQASANIRKCNDKFEWTQNKHLHH